MKQLLATVERERSEKLLLIKHKPAEDISRIQLLLRSYVLNLPALDYRREFYGECRSNLHYDVLFSFFEDPNISHSHNALPSNVTIPKHNRKRARKV